MLFTYTDIFCRSNIYESSERAGGMPADTQILQAWWIFSANKTLFYVYIYIFWLPAAAFVINSWVSYLYILSSSWLPGIFTENFSWNEQLFLPSSL